jgi:chromosome segregation and condensation protein ScpB
MARKPVKPTAEVQSLRQQAAKMEDEIEESIKREAVEAHDQRIGGAGTEAGKETVKGELERAVPPAVALPEKETGQEDDAFGDDADSKDAKELENTVASADAEPPGANSKGTMITKVAEEEPEYEEEGDIGQSALDQLSENAAQKPELDKAKVIEAALFLANKPLAPAELALLAHCTVKQATRFLNSLQADYDEKQSALMIEFANNEARLQVRGTYLPAVSQLSKEIELSRKGLKILALIAKKGQILQSGLKNYFRGEIYEYVSELKERGYITAERHGNTRLLKPTRRFFEHFQQAQ